MESRWMSVPQAAEYLRVSVFTIYRATKKGKIPHARVGARVLIDKIALDAMLEKNSIPMKISKNEKPYLRAYP